MGGETGEAIGEVITASERSSCQTVTFPSYVLSARNARGAVTYARVILQRNGGSLEAARARVEGVHGSPGHWHCLSPVCSCQACSASQVWAPKRLFGLFLGRVHALVWPLRSSSAFGNGQRGLDKGTKRRDSPFTVKPGVNQLRELWQCFLSFSTSSILVVCAKNENNPPFLLGRPSSPHGDPWTLQWQLLSQQPLPGVFRHLAPSALVKPVSAASCFPHQLYPKSIVRPAFCHTALDTKVSYKGWK